MIISNHTPGEKRNLQNLDQREYGSVIRLQTYAPMIVGSNPTVTHHNHSSSEDRSGGFFFLDTIKCLFHADLFTAIFHISVASSAFSSGRR